MVSKFLDSNPVEGGWVVDSGAVEPSLLGTLKSNPLSSGIAAAFSVSHMETSEG